MVSSPSVIIAALNLTPSLRERLADEGELLTFADTEPIQALQTILERHPRLIVLERLFAATPRGTRITYTSPSFVGDSNTTWVVRGRVDAGATANTLHAEANCLAV